jgi:protein SCO1/2
VQFLLLLIMLPVAAVAHENTAPGQARLERRELRVPINDFTLLDQASRPFRLASLRGKVVFVGFAYTTCPDLCPLLTAAMRQLQDRLDSAERAATYLLTVTTDPEVDTPKVLAAYAARNGVDLSNWAFVTGNVATLAQVWRNFGVKVTRKGRGLVDHTTLSGIIDRAGTLRVVYLNAAPSAASVRDDLRLFWR